MKLKSFSIKLIPSRVSLIGLANVSKIIELPFQFSELIVTRRGMSYDPVK